MDISQSTGGNIICTGYDVIIFCPYVIAIANVLMHTNLAGLIVARAA